MSRKTHLFYGGITMTTVYFIRHGQSEANLSQRFAGFIDVQLTELGRQQAKCTAEFLADVPFAAVYSSDLARAYDTACAVASLHGLSVERVADLREINAGAWENCRYDELYETDAAFQLWTREIGKAVCTNGESVARLQARVRAVVEGIVARHPNEAICIVSHGTPIRALASLYTNTSLEQMHTVPWASNASVMVVEFETPQQGRMVSYDLHEHLQELASKLPKNV